MKAISLALILGFGFWAQSATAQIVPDSSVGTIVLPTNLINGGTRTGNNLFHSFSQFSIPTSGSATFNNAIDIQNIFSRVTGTTQSSIDGLIKAQGNANLFLMNPNGIVFGPNAKLDIGGSFIGTTATSIKFVDGVQFSASDLSLNPLLTVSLPIGLQMGNNPGTIAVTGNGHNLTTTNPLLSPFVMPAGSNPGLAIKPNQTLALVGGLINLNGGILTAPEGRIELGGVNQGNVTLTPIAQGYRLSYPDAITFGDIQMSKRSLLDVNKVTAGSIQLQGRDISLSGGSSVWLQNRGPRLSGDLNVNASRKVIISGTSPNFKIASSIHTETITTGMGGALNITTPELLLTAGGMAGTRTYGAARGGNFNVFTQNLITQDSAPSVPDLYSRLLTNTFGRGTAGDLTISTQNLQVLNGAYVGSTTVGPGQGGKVLVNADTIDVNGGTPKSYSIIAGTTVGLGGDAGSVTVNTRILKLSTQGLVTTSSLGVGSAGDLTVNASESIEISSGEISGKAYPSYISSTVSRPNAAYRQAFGLSGVLKGSSGNLTITTPLLKVSGRSGVRSRNFGIGDGGKLLINAGEIQLTNSDINASALSGQGGNIEIQSQRILLRQGSLISATVGETGNGGNINIFSPIILGLENSDIVANAKKGSGGNIQITTQGIFGLKYRDRLTSENDITASSEFGINGMVQINSLGLDPSSGLVKLDGEVVDSSRSIAKGCSANQGNSFVSTGRGGIPQAPKNKADRSWHDLRTLSSSTIASSPQLISKSEPIVEATAFHHNPQTNELELITDKTIAPSLSSASCGISNLP